MGSVDQLRERYRIMLTDELERLNAQENDFFQEFREDFMPASLHGFTEEGGQPRRGVKIQDEKISAPEEKPDLTKTVVINKL